jgi:hypothetical protein
LIGPSTLIPKDVDAPDKPGHDGKREKDQGQANAHFYIVHNLITLYMNGTSSSPQGEAQ